MKPDAFIGREAALAELADVLLTRTKGRRHAFVDGRRKVGKSALLQQFKARHPEHKILLVNLEHIVSSPQLFARNFLAQVVGQLRGVEVPYTVDLPQLGTLLGQQADGLAAAVEPLLQLLATERPDHVELLRNTFELPAKLAELLQTKLVVLLDNFENLLNLRSYPELKRVDKVVGEVLAFQEGVSYGVSGTKSAQLLQIFKKAGFWERKFKHLVLPPLSREDTYVLASTLFSCEQRTIPREVLPTIFYYSQGIPFYVNALCNRALTLARRETRPVNQELVNRAFILEVLREDGLINAVCHSMYFDSLAAVPGDNSLRAVLQVLAAQEGLHLADVGRRIGRPNGQVFGYLKSLLESDLLFLHDGKHYSYRDPLLRFFISQTMFNNFANLEWSDARVEVLAKRFFEEFVLKRPDLGFELEFRVKLVCGHFDGRQVDGKPFGSAVPIVLPDGDDDGLLIDFDAEGTVTGTPGIVVSDFFLKGKRRWMVEIHRGEDQVDVKDLDAFQRKRRFFEARLRVVFDRLWIVSPIGFSEACLERAPGEQALLTRVDDLPAIERELLEEKAEQPLGGAAA